MCELNWLLILEYLKVFLSWPPMAMFTALVFFSRFRVALQSLLNRVIEGNVFGQSFKAQPPVAQDMGTAGVSPDPLARAAEANHSQHQNTNEIDPSAVPLELKNDPAVKTAIAYVQANPAATVLEFKRLWTAYNNERLFVSIYGTQISLLEHLSARPTEGASLPEIATFHAAHQTLIGRTDYQLHDYVGFLLNFAVISIEGSPESSKYRITQDGSNFLSYIKAKYPIAWNKRAY